MVWTSHLPAALAERRCYGNILVVEAMELCSLLLLNIRGTSSSDQTYANGVCFMLKVIELILVACVSLLFVIIVLFGHLSSRSFPNPWIDNPKNERTSTANSIFPGSKDGPIFGLPYQSWLDQVFPFT